AGFRLVLGHRGFRVGGGRFLHRRREARRQSMAPVHCRRRPGGRRDHPDCARPESVMTASGGPNNTTAPAESWSPTSGRRDLGEGRWGRSGRRGTELAHTSMASFVRGVSVARAIRFFIVLAGVLLPRDCVGGGTVSLLLRQKPEVRTFLMSALDMDNTVMAAVRFGSHVQHLGGAHMGPYMIQARPRTPKGALGIEGVLCTDAR